MDDRVSLREALTVVQQTKDMIAELESMLPNSDNRNFRERLVFELEHGNPDAEFRQKARHLLLIYEKEFGVKDLIDQVNQTNDLE
jgi:hypothetical protein